ncbi:LysR substrate-binding domain-containing protein [Celerinatantimonas diazotrophica]|uniref:LysR substrate-binding domain-containing protein n=1 Tax=Celerinatantimonas diazotrophica TaxID=412034 RepID=UPI001CC5C702|nr:LysR substrate-binding domain-containing protein [Celerinatantimonas diazotrophica]CAG9297330.1 HTH-type transcriptional regulator MetR [Celerinatantimonas diazotrophica]
MIEIRHLRTLQSLAQSGSVSRAAEQLYISQSALSHQLKELEQRLGCTLFIRKTTPLKFTESGRILLELAGDILPKIYQAEQRLGNRTDIPPNELALALECHSCYLWLLPVLKAFSKQWPEIHVELINEHPFDALSALQSGELQWVLSANPQTTEQINYAPLFHYETVVVCSSHHPLAKEPYLQPSHLSQAHLITYPIAEQRLDVFSEFLQPAGVKPATVHYTRHPLMMLQQVSQSDALAALPVGSSKNSDRHWISKCLLWEIKGYGVPCI